MEMSNSRGRPISPADVMFTVSKLARMSQKDGGDGQFDGDVGKIQINQESGNAVFDMGVSYKFLVSLPMVHRYPSDACGTHHPTRCDSICFRSKTPRGLSNSARTLMPGVLFSR